VIALYDHLLALTDSPVVILNRAVARAEVDGPHAALADLAPLEADKRMLSYQPYWAAKGHLFSRAGDTATAVEALTVAIGLTTDEAVKGYLLGRLASLQATARPSER
jgi:RNA polymerase sigma-70 factor (ECF subfamily)